MSILDGALDFQEFYKPIPINVKGLAPTADEPNVAHHWRIVCRKDVSDKYVLETTDNGIGADYQLVSNLIQSLCAFHGAGLIYAMLSGEAVGAIVHWIDCVSAQLVQWCNGAGVMVQAMV